MSITKSDICKGIAFSTSLNFDSSNKFFSTFIQLVARNSKTKKVKISKFGSFYTTKTKRGIGRNPKTLEQHLINPRLKLNFVPSNKIRKILN